jgi:hypothetical protein
MEAGMSSFHKALRLRATRWSCFLGVVGLVCACTPGMVNPEVPPPGSPTFQDGYLNGCASGFSDAGRPGYQTSYVKDEKRYASDADYRKGWDDGYHACFEEQTRTPKTLPGD